MRHPETEIQKAVKVYLDRLRVPINASCGGMRTSIRQAVAHKAMGAKKGFPDLFIYRAKKGFHGMAIEIKSANGKPTPEQEEWQKTLTAEGFYSVICPKFKTDHECFDWIIQKINEYLELK